MTKIIIGINRGKNIAFDSDVFIYKNGAEKFKASKMKQGDKKRIIHGLIDKGYSKEQIRIKTGMSNAHVNSVFNKYKGITPRKRRTKYDK